jgi:hypothetical protein
MPNCEQNLSAWIRNNWRPYHTHRGLVPNERKKSRLDIIWMEMKEKVKDEIYAMMKEEGLSSELTAADIFKRRTTAAKRVYQSLSPDDQAAVQKKIDDRTDVVPDEIKQR